MIKNDSTNSENEKRFVNIAKEPIFIVVNDTFEDEVLVDDEVVDCLNKLATKCSKLEKENEQLKTKNNAYLQDIEMFKEENTALKLENEQLKNNIGEQGVKLDFAICETQDFKNKWLKLKKENEQLFNFKEKVFNLIDGKIQRGEQAIEWGESVEADVGAMGFHIEMLRMLKKELSE